MLPPDSFFMGKKTDVVQLTLFNNSTETEVPTLEKGKKNGNTTFNASEDNTRTNGVVTSGQDGSSSQSVITVTVTDTSPEENSEKTTKCFGLWPPRKKLSQYLIIIITSGFLWGILWSITNEDAVPGGHIFALIMLIAACWMFGELVGKLRLPALLGMLIMGFIIRNWPLPNLKIAIELRNDWSAVLRNAALTIILTRAGMGLDPVRLKKLSWVCLRLACIPCIVEGLVAGAVAYWLFGFPLLFGFTLGFILAGLSPAVVVPPMLWLQEEGLGVEKGIPTLGVFIAGVDDALAVAVFGIFNSVSFSNAALWFTIIQGPLEILMGVTYGIVMGVVTWYLPNKNSKSVVFPRFLLLFFGNLFAIFVSKEIDFAGAGAVGTLVFAFVAAIGWRKDNNRDKEVARVYAIVWLFMQPVLFGLIGAEIGLDSLNGEIVGKSLAVILFGLLGRTVVGTLCVLKSGFNWKEIIFIQFMCIPKATVQAAIGPLVLDTARQLHAGPDAEQVGLLILMIAALSILICAPLGGITIALSARKLLKKASPENIPQDADFAAE